MPWPFQSPDSWPLTFLQAAPTYPLCVSLLCEKLKTLPPIFTLILSAWHSLYKVPLARGLMWWRGGPRSSRRRGSELVLQPAGDNLLSAGRHACFCTRIVSFRSSVIARRCRCLLRWGNHDSAGFSAPGPHACSSPRCHTVSGNLKEDQA